MNEELLPSIWKRRFLSICLLVFVGAAIYLLRDVLMPFLLAWIFAYLVSPLVTFFEKKMGFSREKSVIFVLGILCFVAIGFVLVTIPIIINEASTLAEEIPQYQTKIESELRVFRSEGKIPPELEELSLQAIDKVRESAPAIAAFLGRVLVGWLGSVVQIVSMLFSFLLFIFVFFFFLRDFPDISKNMINGVPVRYRDTMTDVIKEMDSNLRAVLRGQLLVAIGMGVLYAVGLSIVGVPYSLLIGMVAGLGNFLPYVGPLFGLLPAYAFVVLHSLGDLSAATGPAVGIMIVFGVVQMLEGFILTPKLAGEAVGLGPVSTLFAISAGGVLLGLFGIVAALPVAAIVKVLLRRGWIFYKTSDYYSQEGDEPPALVGPFPSDALQDDQIVSTFLGRFKSFFTR